MTYKIKDFIAIFLIQLVLTLPFFTADAFALTISDVKVTKITATSATVEWNTDLPATGKVKYGKTMELGLAETNSTLAKDHAINLKNQIKNDSTYFFSLESQDFDKNTAIDNNNGKFYTFKTLDAVPPPKLTGFRIVSSTSNSVTLSWDAWASAEFDHYVVYKNGAAIANAQTNSYTDSTFTSGSSSIYKVSAYDKNGNGGILSEPVAAGSDPQRPEITQFLSDISIPRYVNRRVIDISGSTKSGSVVTLYLNGNSVKTLGSNEVLTGRFAFNQVQLQDNNNIKITAKDNAGTTVDKTFEVGVDTESPVVKLSSIVNITSKIELNITGSVSEPVTVSVFMDSSANNSATPPKIKKLNSTKITQNSVELKWELSQDKDFSHYVLYRNSIPIATASPSSFTVFTDALVDSGKEYNYQISVVNIFGKEGDKSDTLTVKTLEGGAILNANYPPVDTLEDFRKPAFTTNISNNFNIGMKLAKGDGTYDVKLVFEDKAGNKFTAQKGITLDTKKPAVKIITPPTGSLVYENVAHEVDIIGKTEPNARVHLYIDRTPFSFDTNVQLAGLPNEAQDVPRSNFDITADFQEKLDNASETALESKCKSSISIKTSCKDGADRSATADRDGNFKFEKIDLTSQFGLSTRIQEVSPTDFRDTVLNSQARDSKKANILIVATDPVGQRGFAKSTVAIGTCWSGNLSWDVIPLTQFQSPTLLSTERMAEGTEALYFYFNYSYIGRGANARITRVSLAKACGTRELMDPRFNVSCRVMPQGETPTKLNKPDNTLTYSVVPLNRLVYYQACLILS